MIELDGSFGEGGGQILRNAAAYAAILCQDICIEKIRAGRSQPGLRRQHLTGLQLLTECCGGTLEGGFVGSQDIVLRFPPRNLENLNETTKMPRILTGDTQTAGSICLLLQAALPFALLGRQRLHCILKGGTNASMAPQYDYWKMVFLPTLLQNCQLESNIIKANVIRRGFFPKGGGEVRVDTNPISGGLSPINLTERGRVVNVDIRSFCAGKCPRKVAVGMANAAKEYLLAHLMGKVEIATNIVYEEPAVASGSGILIIANTSSGCRLAGSGLGSRKSLPQSVGLEAAKELCRTIEEGGCVDDYLQDQLILYMALAEGTSEMITGSMTLHTKTAIWVAEKCCGAQFHVEQLEDVDIKLRDGDGRLSGRHRIRCTGIGFK